MLHLVDIIIPQSHLKKRMNTMYVFQLSRNTCVNVRRNHLLPSLALHALSPTVTSVNPAFQPVSYQRLIKFKCDPLINGYLCVFCQTITEATSVRQ